MNGPAAAGIVCFRPSDGPLRETMTMRERPLSQPPAATAEEPARKRPYVAPALTTFGSVEEFTRGTGTSSNDGRGGRIRT